MQQVNALRGLITKAEGNVAKWTKIEDCYRKDLRSENAEGAKKCLVKAMAKLDELRKKFEMMEFPNSNIVIVKTKTVQCEGCGEKIAEGNTYCGECLCED